MSNPLPFLRPVKWRTHSNVVMNCDAVSWASCVHNRELIKVFFIRQTGRWAGRQASNDVTLSNYITFSSHKGFYLVRGKENLLPSQFAVCSIFNLLFARSSICCLLASWFAVCSIFGLLFGSKSSVCHLVCKSFFSTQISCL